MEKRAELFVRLGLFLMVSVVNILLYMLGVRYTWAVFLSNILLFLLPGSLRDRFLSVEVGGAVGLCFAYALLYGITVLSPIVGKLVGFAVPLCVALFFLIVLQPRAPHVFNSCGFAYLCCACISAEDFAHNFIQVFVTFALGSLLMGGLSWLVLRYAPKLAAFTDGKTLRQNRTERSKNGPRAKG